MRVGRLQQVHRGVYAVGHPHVGLEARTLDARDHPYLEVDFFWPAYGLIVETDGDDTHGTRKAFEADRAKDAALTAAGLRVVLFTWNTAEETIV